YDKTPPTGSLTINDGAAATDSTTVTLRISASDALSGVSEMRFSNDGSTWSEWEGFSSTRSNWDLSRFGGSAEPGSKTVYAQVRDRAGNVSQVFSAAIRLTPYTVCPSGCPFTRIQPAIDAAKSGDTITIGPGTYSENLTITKSLILDGAGRVTLSGDEANPAVSIKYARDITIKGFVIKNGRFGILVERSSRVTVTNSTIEENTINGIFIEDSTEVSVTESRIINNKPGRDGKFGIGINIIRSKADILNNTISWNSREGIAIQDNSQAEIKGNQILNTKADAEVWGSGVVILRGSTATISNNAIHNNTGVGIDVITNSRATISNNTISENDYEGIHVKANSNATITDNTIEKNGEIGILIWIDSEAEIRGNKITNTKLNPESMIGDGIEIIDNSKVTMENNIITGSGRIGVWVGGGHYYADPTRTFRSSIAIVKNNTISSNQAGGVEIHSSQVTLEKNTIEDNIVEGIWIGGTAKVEVIDNRIQNNKPNAQGNFGDGIAVEDNAQVTIKGNIITNNARLGIGLWDSAKAAIQNNIIKDNGSCGIYADSSTNITSCSGNTVFGNKHGDYCGAARGRCF
ncbi:MAG: right-handed parallel beta-helix repeat-containing protein, partial [bacterium]